MGSHGLPQKKKVQLTFGAHSHISITLLEFTCFVVDLTSIVYHG